MCTWNRSSLFGYKSCFKSAKHPNSLFGSDLEVFYIFGVNRSTFGLWLLYLVKNRVCLICNYVIFICVSLSFLLGPFYTKGILQKNILSFPVEILSNLFFFTFTYHLSLCFMS